MVGCGKLGVGLNAKIYKLSAITAVEELHVLPSACVYLSNQMYRRYRLHPLECPFQATQTTEKNEYNLTPVE